MTDTTTPRTVLNFGAFGIPDAYLDSPASRDEILTLIGDELTSAGYDMDVVNLRTFDDCGGVDVITRDDHFVLGTVTTYRPETAEKNCLLCKTTAAAPGTCCSSHEKELCHLCYRRTHFVELCVDGCKDCAAENLPVNLRDREVTR